VSAPDILVCAGLDPSGGAGLIADVRVAALVGARPVGLVTALTVQDTRGARAVHPVDPEVLGAQVTALLADVEVRAVKLGLLGSAAVARALGAGLHLTAAPVVWDPISAPSLGDAAFDRGFFADALRSLAPHLTLITPNARDLAALEGGDAAALEADLDARVAAARQLAERAAAAVLAKGGHGAEAEAVDALVTATGVELLVGPRVPGGERVHGTGCALSTAIAAHLAAGMALVDACRAAKAFVAARIADPVRPGRGAAAIV
jgi:hydroxymethylpyrimidine/phosphomethylpyrimidine kinase